MYTIEQEVGIGLAFVHATNRKQMPGLFAYAWAKRHWMEFLDELDTPTGQMLIREAHRKRRDGGPTNKPA